MTTEFYLVRLEPWKWAKTEDLSQNNDNIFYDDSPGGVLLESSATCPQCEGELCITAGKDTANNIAVRWSCCNACGLSGDVVGSHGEGDIIKDKDHNEHIILPSCIVIEVGID
jgi:hypothetical protein